MSDTQKETIIIVHGTWAAPNGGSVKWYQPGRDMATAGQGFVAKLDLALEKRGSPARCWAHCQDTSSIFCWSGHNAWIDRVHASTELASSVNRLQSEGWRVHIIAHSHGGGVAVDALPALKGTEANPSGISGTVTTLGTTFMDVMSPIAKRLDRRRRIYEIVAWPSYVLLFLIAVVNLYTAVIAQFALVYSILSFFALIGLFLIGLFSFLRSRRREGWRQYWDNLATANPTGLFMLIMGSRMDETRQLLHHLRNIESPLSPKSWWLGYVLGSWRDYLRKSCEVERIHGAALFREQPWSTKIAAVALLVPLLLLVLSLTVFFVVAWKADPHPSCDPADSYHSWFIEFQVKQGKRNAAIEAVVWSRNFDLLKKTVDEEIAKLPPEEEAKWRDYKESKQRTARMDLFTAVLSGSGFFFVLWFSLASAFTFYFGRSFYSVVWSPFRWLGRQVRALKNVPSFTISYVVRRNAWSQLQELTMGLEGYRLMLPGADKMPTYVPPTCFTYEDMPKSAERRALAKRDEWIGRHFGNVSETLSKLVITAADVSALLRMVENDMSLVHAAYYTDDDCIARIAEWIAGPDGERQLKTAAARVAPAA